MTATMVDEIVETFDRLEADDTIGAVVVTGEPPAFCCGADVSSLGALAAERTDARERGSVVSIYEGFLRVLRSPLPTIAAVNGPAVGAGMNLALACDVRLAATSARFDSPLPAHRPAPRGRAHVDARTGGRPAGRGRDRAVRRAGRRHPRRGDRARVACVPDDELARPPRASSRAAPRRVPKALLAATKATLREVPWQPDFDARARAEVERQTWSLGQGWFRRPT